jgi:oligoendopeptidase F
MIKEPNMTEVKVPERKDIAPEFTWNAESVYPTIGDWETELGNLEAEYERIDGYQGQVKDSPAKLAEILRDRDEIIRRVYVAFMYAMMWHEVDKGDQQSATMPGKAQASLGKALSATAFIEPELIAIGQETIEKWMKGEAKLQVYHQYFTDLFRKQAHVRSAEVEALLGALADPFTMVGQTAGILTDADLKFKPAVNSSGVEVEVSQGSFDEIMADPDRQARRTAWENYQDGYLAFKNTLANNLVTSIKQNVFTARTRRHDSTLEASLFSNNIPLTVYHNLIDTFRKHLPTWHRYFAIRRKALGLKDLQVYDIWAPLTKTPPKVSYQQAVDWVCEGLAPMGKEYVANLRKGCLQQRWVDVYPNQGKTSGAFSFGAPGTYPFIVMSFTDEIHSLSTLAHELGHSMHSYLTWQNQPTVYSEYSLFVAEVASNFHQAMVRAYLLENQTDPNFQIAVIEEAMANYYRYFFTMPTLARFELETHLRIERGEGLSADNLNDLMADLLGEAYGSEVTIDRARYGITWATYSHLYSDYYVYQYATGISGANALSRRILTGIPGSVDDYLGFLKAGSSMYPLDVLKRAGVDLTTTKPVEESFAVLEGYVDRLEALIA